MKRNYDPEKLKGLMPYDDLLDEKYGLPGTSSRDAFEAQARAWYEEVCSQPDPEEAEDSSEASRPRILSSRLPRVAAL